MTDLSRFDFSRSRAVLKEIQDVLKCPLCQRVCLDPYSLGQCAHFFCKACLDDFHSGGRCPAPGCSASAPAKASAPNKTISSFIRNTITIANIFGDKPTDRLKPLLSVGSEDENEENVINASKNSPCGPIRESSGGKGSNADATKTSRRGKGKSTAAVSGVSSSLDAAVKTFSSIPAVHQPEQKPRRARKSRPVVQSTFNGSPTKSENISTYSSSASPARKNVKKREPPSDAPKPQAKRARIAKTPDIKTKSPAQTSVRKKPSTLEKKNKKGETNLHSATIKGDMGTVKGLLEQGANPNTMDNAGWTPLHEASIAGNVELVKILLDHGANPNLHAAEENVTPLHDACSNGFTDVVRLLVARGANTAAKNFQGLTPRDVAVQSQELLKALSETEVEITRSQENNKTAFHQDLTDASKVWISCPSASDTEFRKICGAASKLGIRKPVRAVSTDTTHTLVDDPAQKMAILSSQLVGAPVLQTEWIYQSRQLGQVVDTEPFLLLPPDLTADGRRRSHDCRIRSQPRLMTGLHFYLAGGYDRKPGKQDIQKLIALSGGKLISREPDPENLPDFERTVPHHAREESALKKTSHIILYEEGGKREPLVKYKMEHVKTLPIIWFLQCILQFQLLEPALYLQ